MNIVIVPDVTTIDGADDAILAALDQVRPDRSGRSSPVALTAVADAYLVRSRLWLDIEISPGPTVGDLVRAVDAAATADRKRAAHWRNLANRNA